jgi:hypothetical protein
MVVDTVRQGEVFVPFHYGHGSASANQHTWYAQDPVSHEPSSNRRPSRSGGRASDSLSRDCLRGLQN